MVNADMRTYDYYLYQDNDAYAQPQLSQDVQGTIKIAIYTASQGIKDSVAYTGTEYIGLTHDAINDKYVILHNDEKLKVLYINTRGTWKQVYMARM